LNVEYRSGSTESILPLADCAVVKSGTSTLEALLSGVPFAMVYRLAWTSYIALRPFVRTQTFCLANLVAGRPLVPEFVQRRATGNRIGAYLEKVLRDPAEAGRIRRELLEAGARLGSRDAYDEAAAVIAGRFVN
jgi:lipid-A-disaccharide synthase